MGRTFNIWANWAGIALLAGSASLRAADDTPPASTPLSAAQRAIEKSANTELLRRIDALKGERIALEAVIDDRAAKVRQLRDERERAKAAALVKAKDAIAANDASLKAAEEIIRIHTKECDVVKRLPGADVVAHDKLLSEASRARQRAILQKDILQNELFAAGRDAPSTKESELGAAMMFDQTRISTLTMQIGLLEKQSQYRPWASPIVFPLPAPATRRSPDLVVATSPKAATEQDGLPPVTGEKTVPPVKERVALSREKADRANQGRGSDATKPSTGSRRTVDLTAQPDEKDPFVGTFATDRYTLRLSPSPTGYGYAGTFKVGETERPARAVWQSGKLVLFVTKADGTSMEIPVIERPGEGIRLGDGADAISFERGRAE